jgi:hypothetical protein
VLEDEEEEEYDPSYPLMHPLDAEQVGGDGISV